MNQNAPLTVEDLRATTGGKFGTHDVACPMCGPHCHSPKNRIRQVLRVWLSDRFGTWCCQRCGSTGWARDTDDDDEGRQIDHEALRRARVESDKREKATAAERLGLARWMWGRRRSVSSSPAEFYLGNVRGCSGPYPATLGYLPPRGDHLGALIAAFGLPIEPEPGVLVMPDDAVMGVQITRLDVNGRKIPDDAKLTIGRCKEWPIVLAPMNDLLGLAIAEGAEDALSLARATGLGAWAAGGAGRMPALADTVPAFTNCTTVAVDDDPAGRRHSLELVARLRARRLNVETLDMAAPT